MARVKQTSEKPQSSSSKSISLDFSSTSSGRTPSPQPTSPPAKRVSIPTHKVLAKDKGKAIATDQGKTKKRKVPQTEKLMGDAMKGPTQKKKKTTSSPQPKKPQPPKGKPVEDIILPPAFLKRKIHEARTMDFAYFDANGFTFQNHLRFHGLVDFLSCSLEIYPRLIRAFYSNFTLTDFGFESEVKGKKIFMTFREFSRLSGLAFYGEVVDGRTNPDSIDDAWETSVDRYTAIQDLMVKGLWKAYLSQLGK